MADGNNDEQPGRCMFSGCCCCYTACDTKNIEICCRYEQDTCCCIRHACCVSLTSKPLGCGCTGDKEQGECCKLGFMCCDLGLVKPVACCTGASACLCCYEVTSFPCNERYVDKCVCAYCFVQCFPKCGVCVAPPSCPALNKLCANDDEIEPMTMDRGDEDTPGADDAPAKEAEETPAAVDAEAEVIEEKEPVAKGEDKEIEC